MGPLTNCRLPRYSVSLVSNPPCKTLPWWACLLGPLEGHWLCIKQNKAERRQEVQMPLHGAETGCSSVRPESGNISRETKWRSGTTLFVVRLLNFRRFCFATSIVSVPFIARVVQFVCFASVDFDRHHRLPTPTWEFMAAGMSVRTI